MNLSTAPLGQALAACVPDLHRHCLDPWVVIGSAAASLVGAKVTVADLDVLTSARDARTLVEHWRQRLLATDTAVDADRFRSHFARFGFALPVEVMGELEVARSGGWAPVHIQDTRMVDLDGLQVPVPSVAEQIRLLGWFGRAKDRERIELLKQLQGNPA